MAPGQAAGTRFRFHRFATLDSTNTEAKRLAEAGATAFTLVLAEAQTAGRGRRGRAWASPPGNLYSSLVLRPSCTPLEAVQVSFVAALAVADAARALLPPAATIACKWPNDVIVNGRKISGVLLESAATAGRLDWLVLGVGINVAHHPGLGGAYPSTALRAEGASIGGTEPVLASYLDGFAAWYDRWRSDGFEAIRAAWRGRALGLGGPVTVRLERETLSGRFVDLDGTGALVIGTAEGAHRSIAAGDVAFASVPQVDRAAGD